MDELSVWMMGIAFVIVGIFMLFGSISVKLREWREGYVRVFYHKPGIDRGPIRDPQIEIIDGIPVGKEK